MIHYIKNVTGVRYFPMRRVDSEMQTLEVYARPFQKYKVWNFFIIICFVYYRTKVAKERLWKRTYHGTPYKDEIYTDEDLKKINHLIVKDDESLWEMPKVIVTLSDGIEETVYFDTNEDAERNVAGLVKNWRLEPYFNLNEFRY